MTDKLTVAESSLPAARSAVPPEMQQLIELALEKEGGTEALERIVALSERMADRAAANEFNAAMAQFQARCPAIGKTSRTDYTTKSGFRVAYNYAELDEIAKTVRPILHDLGLSYSWDSTVDSGVVNVTCKLRHENGHESTASFGVPVDNAAKMSAAQAITAANTYAKRQALVSVLGLTMTEPDTDGAPVATITDKQAANLEALATEVGANMPKFLAHLGVDALEHLQANRYEHAVKALERKR